ncbi:hypothetical protein P692DRAFT_20106724 [Suillus brevipes Sb2]|nr:hypothetical protein P692DRAFT_20106724 [Suillus brevipes Sb2]
MSTVNVSTMSHTVTSNLEHFHTPSSIGNLAPVTYMQLRNIFFLLRTACKMGGGQQLAKIEVVRRSLNSLSRTPAAPVSTPSRHRGKPQLALQSNCQRTIPRLVRKTPAPLPINNTSDFQRIPMQHLSNFSVLKTSVIFLPTDHMRLRYWMLRPVFGDAEFPRAGLSNIFS